jgi:hypothetical protein
LKKKYTFFRPKIYLDAAPSEFAYLHPGIKRTPDVAFWIRTAYSLIGITIRESSCVFTTLVTLSDNNHNPEDRNMKAPRHEDVAWIRKTGVSGTKNRRPIFC